MDFMLHASYQEIAPTDLGPIYNAPGAQNMAMRNVPGPIGRGSSARRAKSARDGTHGSFVHR